jgi:hypothetical protein
MKRLIFLILPTLLCAAPAQVILMTHAESSEDVLSLKGRMRAAALAPFFKGAPEVNFNGPPSAIYATSELAAHTLEPLSVDLEVPISMYRSSPENLALEILTNPDFEANTVLVCRPASDLPTLAKKLGAKKAPKSWSSDSHDRIWIISYNETGEISFQNISQKLLYGDSK